MARRLSVLLIAAAILGLTTFGLPAAVAAPTASTDVTAAGGWRVPRPTPVRQRHPARQRYPARHRHRRHPPLRARSRLPASTVPAYCPATIATVQGTMYGIGTRVVLKGVTVTTVGQGTPSTVTVAAWALPPCSPGHFCGQTLTLQSLTVTWSGTSRPELRRRARPVRFHHHGLHHPSRLHQDRLLPDRLVLTTLCGAGPGGVPSQRKWLRCD